MVVENFKCLTCKNIEVCKGYATLKKFDADSCRNPFPVDIKILNCQIYAENNAEDPSDVTYNGPRDIDDAEDVE